MTVTTAKVVHAICTAERTGCPSRLALRPHEVVTNGGMKKATMSSPITVQVSHAGTPLSWSWG